MSIYHQILGVLENSSIEEIKEKYRELCKKYHPDISNNDSINKMALINEAYDVLVKRKDIKILKHTETKRSKEGLIIYKDQAYAFYKQAIKVQNETRILGQQIGLSHNEEVLLKYESKILKALYYFNVVCMQYSESEWYDDSIEKIKEINRDRKFIKNIRDYSKHRQ
jgi:curved DNA-binding protein CbpA